MQNSAVIVGIMDTSKSHFQTTPRHTTDCSIILCHATRYRRHASSCGLGMSRHTNHVTCHMSHVACGMSRVTGHIGSTRLRRLGLRLRTGTRQHPPRKDFPRKRKHTKQVPDQYRPRGKNRLIYALCVSSSRLDVLCAHTLLTQAVADWALRFTALSARRSQRGPAGAGLGLQPKGRGRPPAPPPSHPPPRTASHHARAHVCSLHACVRAWMTRTRGRMLSSNVFVDAYFHGCMDAWTHGRMDSWM